MVPVMGDTSESVEGFVEKPVALFGGARITDWMANGHALID